MPTNIIKYYRKFQLCGNLKIRTMRHIDSNAAAERVAAGAFCQSGTEGLDEKPGKWD